LSKGSSTLILVLILFMSGFTCVHVNAQDVASCDQDKETLNDDSSIIIEISEALAREDVTIPINYIASVELQDNDVELARKRALRLASRHLLRLLTKRMVSDEQYKKSQAKINQKVLRRARVFIHSFRTSKAIVCDGDYRVPLRVVLKADVLRKSLLKYRILDIEFVGKEIRLINVLHAKDYEWMKGQIKRRVRNLNRVVEKYLRKNEVHLLVETSSSLDEMISRLEPAIIRASDSPNFKIEKGEQGGLDITFISGS